MLSALKTLQVGDEKSASRSRALEVELDCSFPAEMPGHVSLLKTAANVESRIWFLGSLEDCAARS
jgi:hypothetical protein